MSNLKSRLAKLEAKAGVEQQIVTIVYHHIVSPLGKSDEDEWEPLWTRLHDGRELIGEPGESVDDFIERFKITDAQYSETKAYMIIGRDEWK